MKKNRSSDKTEKILKQCFIEQLNEKRIDKITVSSLCKAADLDRTTFYIHFLDVYDLKDSIENDIIKSIYDINNKIEKENIPVEDVLGIFLKLIKDNKNLLKVLLLNNIDSKLWQNIGETMQAYFIKKLLEGYDIPDNISHEDFVFIIKFLMSGFYNIYIDWILNDCTEPESDIIRRSQMTVSACFDFLLIKK